MIGKNGNPAGPRRGLSGEGDRPWLAVWMVLLDRALDRSEVPAEIRPHWKAAVGAFLLEFRRHPALIPALGIREWLFRTGELGGASLERSLPLAMDALAFFYSEVVPRPVLAQAARRPFSGGPLSDRARPDWGGPPHGTLLAILLEKLAESGAVGFVAGPAASGDWSPT